MALRLSPRAAHRNSTPESVSTNVVPTTKLSNLAVSCPQYSSVDNNNEEGEEGEEDDDIEQQPNDTETLTSLSSDDDDTCTKDTYFSDDDESSDGEWNNRAKDVKCLRLLVASAKD